jgi:hypothetical protein
LTCHLSAMGVTPQLATFRPITVAKPTNRELDTRLWVSQLLIIWLLQLPPMGSV